MKLEKAKMPDKWGRGMASILTEFLESEMDSAKIILERGEEDTNLNSLYNKLKIQIARYKLKIKVHQRKGEIYLIKKEGVD